MALADDMLQRYFDGDLSEAEAEVVRKTLEESATERARLRALERSRTLIRVAANESAKELDSEALFARVRAGVSDASVAQATGSVRSLEDASQRKRKSAWIPVAAVLAIAAAVLLAIVVRNKTPEPTAQEVDRHPPAEAVARTASPNTPAPHGSSVVEVDFGSNTGTVFEVEGATGEPLAVVWINDEGIDPNGQVLQ